MEFVPQVLALAAGLGRGEYEFVVKPAAWRSVKRQKEKHLGRLVRDRTLFGRSGGGEPLVEVGSFFDWLGEPVPVQPDWAKAFEIVDGPKLSEVSSQRDGRERARRAYSEGPTVPVVSLPGYSMDTPKLSMVDELVIVHRERLRSGIQENWQKLRAAEQVIDEVAEEFDGEDPLLPVLRQMVEFTRAGLTDLHEEAQRYTGPFDLITRTEAHLKFVRGLVERDF